MSQLNAKNEDKALVKKAEDPKGILAEAKGIAEQQDANSFVASVRHLAMARKSHITYVNLVGPYRTGQLVALSGLVLIVTALLWSILRAEAVEGMSLYGVLATLTFGVVLTTLGLRRIRNIDHLDEMLPPSISEADVSEAARVVSTFGAFRHSIGSAITGVASAVDGSVAGWVISAALVASTPVWIQGLASLGVAVLMVLVAGALSEFFRAQVAIIRARLMARHALDLKEEHYKGAADEATYIVDWTKPITGNNLDNPGWKAYAAAAGMLLGIVLLFVLLAAIRLLSPSDGTGLASGVVVATAMLGALFAMLGALVNAMGPLRPDEQRKATLLHDRYPSVAMFRTQKTRQERSIDMWCNSLVRRVRASYMDLYKNMDPRKRGRAVDIPEPFPIDDKTDGDRSAQVATDAASGATVVPAAAAATGKVASAGTAQPEPAAVNHFGAQGDIYGFQPKTAGTSHIVGGVQ